MRRLVPLTLPALVGLLAMASCQDEAHPAPVVAVEPPVASPEAIPDAPVSGRIHGAPFVLRDARYVIDRRTGYAHTDIALSSGTTETACAPVSPPTSTTVWLRLEGPDRIESTNARVGPGTPGRWSVHYQVFEENAWVGVGNGSAVVSLHEPGPDGHLSGGLAVCFSDESKSCVSGSFEAVACPSRLDQTVRGTLPPEAIPPAYLQRVLLDAGPP
jgi:hypothetical protein